MNEIGIDKVKHFAVCIVVTCVVAIVFSGVSKMYGGDVPNAVCGAIGVEFALVLGVGKEAEDYLQSKKFDFSDFLADVAGAVVGFVFALLM